MDKIVTPPVHSPEATVTLGEKRVNINELTWPKMMAFLKIIGRGISHLITNTEKGVKVDFDKEKIVEIVSASEDAVSFLLENATSLTPDEVNKLGVRDCLRVLKPVIELNLSQEILGEVKGLAGALLDRPATTIEQLPKS